jgi:hypothetical protein
VELTRPSLNHASIATTQRYLHNARTLSASAIDKLPSLE